MNQPLGTAAYADPRSNNADLLENLEGCTVHRFSPGTKEHAGTALMVTKLPTGDGLGVQVSMNEDGEHIPTYTGTHDDNWAIEPMPTIKTLTELEADCPNLTIREVTHKNIMNPDTARLVAILDNGNDYYALDIHLDETGSTEFFEVPL